MNPAHISAWARWMAAAGMATRTVTERVRFIARFELETGIDPVSADWEDLADYLATLPTPGTRSTYYAHLRAWFHWLCLMDLRLDDPTIKLRSPKTPRREPRPVTLDQMGKILATPMHLRTRASVLLGAYQGFRVSEIATVRAEHISDGRIRVIGKGGTDATLPLHDLVASIAEKMPARGLWFPSHTNFGPVRAKSVSAYIKNVMRRAGVPGTPHSLRHFFGTQVLESSGGNLRVTQELMRHASVASTQIYTKVDDARRRAAIDALPLPPGLVA